MAVIRSAAEAQLKRAINYQVVDIYRRMCREMPKIIVMYNLPYSVGELRHILLLHFRRHGYVTDPSITQMLLTKADEKFMEVMEGHWTEYHVHTFLQVEYVEAKSNDTLEGMLDEFADNVLNLPGSHSSVRKTVHGRRPDFTIPE